MPFTFAHPAAVFPFKYLPERYYSWAGLIIGSMVPDFEAFVNLGGGKVLSHSWQGIFTYDLPLGLLLVLIFHYIVRNAFIASLPGFLKSRFGVYSRIKNEHYFTKRYLAILTSLLIGIATHLIWDRITHTDTYTYKEMIGIKLSWQRSYELRVVLQWGCSLIGMMLLLWQIIDLPKDKNLSLHILPTYWLVVFAVTALVYFVRLQFHHVGDDMINAFIGAFFHGIIAASVLYNLKFYRSIVIPKKLKRQSA